MYNLHDILLLQPPVEYLSLDRMQKWILCKCLHKWFYFIRKSHQLKWVFFLWELNLRSAGMSSCSVDCHKELCMIFFFFLLYSWIHTLSSATCHAWCDRHLEDCITRWLLCYFVPWWSHYVSQGVSKFTRWDERVR